MSKTEYTAHPEYFLVQSAPIHSIPAWNTPALAAFVPRSENPSIMFRKTYGGGFMDRSRANMFACFPRGMGLFARGQVYGIILMCKSFSTWIAWIKGGAMQNALTRWLPTDCGAWPVCTVHGLFFSYIICFLSIFPSLLTAPFSPFFPFFFKIVSWRGSVGLSCYARVYCLL